MKIIAANWKMNGNATFANDFVSAINKIESTHTVVVCPPVALLHLFVEFKYSLGAQNCFYEEKGAFTGENSPVLLKELGCSYVLIGHSERRTLMNEDDSLVYKKWTAAARAGLTPIVCIGERAEERNDWQSVISRQVQEFISKDLSNTIFAYEPVWSIGTGVVPSIDEIEEVITFVKSKIGDNAKVLYGGSVNAKNYKEILSCEVVDGLLIGGASLKIDEFSQIIS